MDFKPPRLPPKPHHEEEPTPVEGPRLPPRPRLRKEEQSPAAPPLLGATRRATMMVDAGELGQLLARDRRAAASRLAHPWFREEPSEEAVDDYAESRRASLVKFAAAMVTVSLTGTLVLLVAAAVG